jgi:hypothetical protein
MHLSEVCGCFEAEDCISATVEDKNAILPVDAAIGPTSETTTRVLARDAARAVLRAFGIGANTDTLEDRPAVLDPRAHPPDRGEGVAPQPSTRRSRKLRSFLDGGRALPSFHPREPAIRPGAMNAPSTPSPSACPALTALAASSSRRS